MKRVQISVIGIVQGVGFRPLTFNLAKKFNLAGFVLNDSLGVKIEIEGRAEDVDNFILELKNNPPKSSKIERISIKEIDFKKETSFLIKQSKNTNNRQNISSDLALCKDCEKELFDPKNRRYRYPFINCYNCGPRFTIIRKMPYDRKNTTMADFKMCPECEAEYKDPSNRRFHAEPIACSKCGPVIAGIRNQESGINVIGEEAIQETIKFIKEGKIVTIKGLGGFQLACDATNEKAVSELRKRKNRPTKPLALMVRDLEVAEEYTKFQKDSTVLEGLTLLGQESPIVLLEKRGSDVSNLIAPNQQDLGIMLPYTPLHKLIFENLEIALVMTSGNISGEPIITDNNEALEKLAKIADYFLMNDRDIHSGYDDSVVKVVDGEVQVIRMARGYAPKKNTINDNLPPMLAVGGDLKSTFALACGNEVYISQYLGDLQGFDNLKRFEETISLYQNLFKIKPKYIVHDLHPGYFSTKWAIKQGIETIAVGHHKAHIASVIAEHQVKEQVVGVAFDGLGYGEDGNLWGGEFFVGDLGSLERAAHFDYFALPGGDVAAKEPWRVAVSLLFKAGVSEQKIKSLFPNKDFISIKKLIELKINSPLTSSAGRIFDAVAAILGFDGPVTYEGEAAMWLENLASFSCHSELDSESYRASREAGFRVKPGMTNGDGFYPLILNTRTINLDKMFVQIIKDLENGVKKETVAAMFQNTIVEIILQKAANLASENQINAVALSGGVFQNSFVLSVSVKKLRAKGLKVYYNKEVPINDGGIALGQVILGAKYLKRV
ncbi:MAG: (NiFe) hydrogenase maturation protein HypF [candidate division CPR2 bacterium GW2011_GWC2_39_10]|uniref:Carbamoyltransferase n=1 Tax=candidate division CPR2 bacterium GW2011_GWC2_39_10 TaxID=1618345 RepID=A0A0G0P7V5_UNCC2|nr:MAG: (NiFe) hydrogenase maturation protein HypF [candidate division CPR2 bacterium GW2011_GWC2_39_10]